MGSTKCLTCRGTGNEIISDKTCPDCKGLGSTKIVLSSYGSSSNDNKCKTCKGTGSLIKKKKCSDCKGKGTIVLCDSCGKNILESIVEGHSTVLCSECKTSPIVFVLKPPCSTRTINIGTYFHAKVKHFKDFGVFAELFPGVEGLIRTKNLKGLQRKDIGKKIIVYVNGKTRDGKLELTPLQI